MPPLLDASESCCELLTQIVVLSTALFNQINVTELWGSFGTGNNCRLIPVQTISKTLGSQKSMSLLMFHAFTDCDQTSFFLNWGKKTAWQTIYGCWRSFCSSYLQRKGNSANPTNLSSTFLAWEKSCISGCLCMRPSLVTGPRDAKPIRLGMNKKNFRHVGA